MNVITKSFRGFLNVTASGVLFLISLVLFLSIAGAPYGGANAKNGELAGLLICGLLTILSAYLTIGFWSRGPNESSSRACSILSGLAFLLYIGSIFYYLIHR